MTVLLAVQALSTSFGSFALAKINFTVAKGEHLVILGPSGAGKTLLIETIVGMRPRTSGSIDYPLLKRSPRISYVPQDLLLFPHLGVLDNIAFAAKIPARSLHALPILARLAKVLKVEAVLDRKDIRSLSLGERQRIALLRALITEPDILFLDEPFAAIDQYLKRELTALLCECKSLFGTTIVQVTHDLDEAFRLADRIALIFNGQLVQIDRPDAVIANPKNCLVASFLLTENIIEAKVMTSDPDGQSHSVMVNSFTLDALSAKEVYRSGQTVHLAIRPEDILIDPSAFHRSDNGHSAAFPAMITKVSRGVGGYRVSLKTEFFDRELTATVQKLPEYFHLGAEIEARIDKRDIRFIGDN